MPIPNNRAVTFLVETSDRKAPRGPELGYDQHVLLNEEQSNARHGGHVPRNTRLALAAVDMVEPYVCFSAGATGVGADEFVDTFSVEWYVGGTHVVDKTWLSWHRSHPIGHDVHVPPSGGGSSSQPVVASPVLSGAGRWLLSDPLRRVHKGNVGSAAGQFEARVGLPPPGVLDGRRSGTVWLVAHAVVDQHWFSEGQGEWPSVHYFGAIFHKWIFLVVQATPGS